VCGIATTMNAHATAAPQVFHAQLDVRRSRRFPVLVPMHNLRTILGTSDAEGLADRVSRALQERVAHAQHNLWRADSWQQLPPAASISVCRADGASIRAALRPQVVVPRMVHHLQQAGSPPVAAQAATAGVAAGLSTSAGGSSCVTAGTGSSLSCSCSTAADSSPGEACSRCHSTETVGTCDRPSSDSAAQLPSGLLSVLHLCQQRMQLLCSQQLSQLQHLYAAKVCNPTMLSQCPRDVGKAAGAHWRPNMAALQAVAGKLPDAAVARYKLCKACGSAAHTAASAQQAGMHVSTALLHAQHGTALILPRCDRPTGVPNSTLLCLLVTGSMPPACLAVLQVKTPQQAAQLLSLCVSSGRVWQLTLACCHTLQLARLHSGKHRWPKQRGWLLRCRLCG
jgi:hypothetical protein